MATRSDASRNLQELQAYCVKNAVNLPEWQIREINKRWQSLGNALRHPGGLFNVKNYN